MSQQVVSDSVKSVYDDFYNELYKYIVRMGMFLRMFGVAIDDTQKFQLYVVIVTSASTQKSKLIKFDMKVKMINDETYFQLDCGKFDAMIKFKYYDFCMDLSDCIHYMTYRCLEGILTPPCQIVEKKFFVYSNHEIIYTDAIRIGLVYYARYNQNNVDILDLVAGDPLKKIEIPMLHCMTDIMGDLLEQCKSLPEMTALDIRLLEKLYKKKKACKNDLNWAKHWKSFTSITQFMAIIAKYMP
jgi:hypothetical protein